MDASVTPDLVVRYLRELAADLVAAAVVDADGRTLAGPERLGAAAADAVASAADGSVVAVRDARHLVVVARGNVHRLVAAHSSRALPGLVRHDLLTALRDLGDAVDAGPPATGERAPATPPAAAAAALLSAAQELSAEAPDLSATRHAQPKRSVFAKIRGV